MRPAGAATNHPTRMATTPDVIQPKNQPQRMWKPGDRVLEAVTSAGSVVTIPASVRDSHASNVASTVCCIPESRIVGVGIAAYVLRSPGYWVPAAQVADGLAVLPLDGVFE